MIAAYIGLSRPIGRYIRELVQRRTHRSNKCGQINMLKLRIASDIDLNRFFIDETIIARRISPCVLSTRWRRVREIARL